MEREKLQQLAAFLRYFVLKISTQAGSGHPTSSLSAVDLMAVLFYKYFRYDFTNPLNPANDRLIFSKGHATPLYYSLFAATGAITTKELETYRKFSNILEGHPTFRFPFAEAATGSLGQGLSVGLGLALAIRRLTGPAAKVSQTTLQNRPQQARTQGHEASFGIPRSRHPSIDYPHVFVLIGDGEMAEGNVWEAVEVASKYKLDNLIAIVDVNRLGQSGETMLGYDLKTYQKRLDAFGWETRVIDGHNFEEIDQCFNESITQFRRKKPFAVIAKTLKGKGVSFLEDKNGWHGKPVPVDMLDRALKELGKVDLEMIVKLKRPQSRIKYYELTKKILNSNLMVDNSYNKGDQVATRYAYGIALAKIGELLPQVVVLDGDVKNSTYSEIFKEKFPDRFYEMYIAEQNMVGTAVGFSRLGFIPFVSTFAAFLTRAFDQIRMAALSNVNIKFCGSHAGVSIGEDGPSQMALEDLAMFRAIDGCQVLYPSDAVSTEKLVMEMAKSKGMCYLRTSRPATPVIYDNNEKFPIGGCKVHRIKNKKQKTKYLRRIIIIASGVTLFEALKAQKELVGTGIETIVVDCYSIKPIDEKTLRDLVTHTFKGSTFKGSLITVEDHYFDGGLGDAVLNVFASDEKIKVFKLAVTKKPRSGKPDELLDYMEISTKAIISKVNSII